MKLSIIAFLLALTTNAQAFPLTWKLQIKDNKKNTIEVIEILETPKLFSFAELHCRLDAETDEHEVERRSYSCKKEKMIFSKISECRQGITRRHQMLNSKDKNDVFVYQDEKLSLEFALYCE
ncbi:hypothetical protein [Bdellovibrio reynosensis]|uniref:Uncharacterized protein n=1 Tax=Bdellovibrio reynosensis TaxID=2835041 RepID=A0ABY4C918_9BACT|nr:hypothetical protein [Bdellovibrio reynosensis]UOF01478.1 hypothetical protein MNR06_00735 [Bdellovibrio reynosensis]